MHSLQIREWGIEEWHAHESQWTTLLGKSGLDPLFLSWEWLTLWWQVFGGRPGQKLRILAAYRGNDLVGIAPLYALRVGRRLLPVQSLQFIGISWRDTSAVVSEYLDFIAEAVERPRIRAAFLEYLLAQGGWSELIVSFTRDAQGWTNVFADSPAAKAFYARTIEPCVSYQADLSDGFQAYLRRLGQSTRRSLWHLRRRLAEQGPVRLESVSAADLPESFTQLNQLHTLRWGMAAFSEDRLRFHHALTQSMAARGELAMSRLWVGDQVVSVLYDVRKGARQYNIKMGFDPRLERSFSMGLIHFGYAMENAVAQGVTVYDFLAGAGRRTDYKSHLGQNRDHLATVQLLKGVLLPRLYRWHDGRKHNVRESIA